MSKYEKLWLGLLFGTVLLLLFALSTMIYKSASVDGAIEYCYIQYDNASANLPNYNLHGYRKWRTDRVIAPYLSAEDAAKAASNIRCPLGIR